MNRRILLAKRPVGLPTPDCFRLEEAPESKPGDGELRLRTLCLSLDPYMRGRMSERAVLCRSRSARRLMVGGTVGARGGVARPRIQGRRPRRRRYRLAGPCASRRPATSQARPGDAPLSWALGVLGMPGLTAYVGPARHRPAEGRRDRRRRRRHRRGRRRSSARSPS